MGIELKSEYIDLGGSNVLLVSVKGGKAVIGTCSTGHNLTRGDSSAVNRVFYIGTEPVVNMSCPNNGDKRTDRIMSLCTGYAGMAHDISEVLETSLTKINRGDSLEMGLREVFMMLADGVYTVYSSEYYPTDGSSTFFWGAYNIPHEVHGTAVYNRTIGKDRAYRPCFLVPGITLDSYTPKKRGVAEEAVKSRKYQGIAYHLTGLHSVLLKGHHGAVVCAEKDIPFRCAVIERIDEAYTVPYAAPVAPAPAEGENAEAAPAPVPEEREGITGFRSASVKIPLELMPKDMLRNLLENRIDYKPVQYPNIVRKLSVVRRKTLSNNMLPKPVHDKCELMPDCEMIESAFAISSLSEGQLEALLTGDTEFNGEVIISPNFYTSIVTACNYLQFHDERKFIEFSVAIMENPELYATHEYIAKRVARLPNNKRVYQFFKSVVMSDNAAFEKIYPSADRYVKDYEIRNQE